MKKLAEPPVDFEDLRKSMKFADEHKIWNLFYNHTKILGLENLLDIQDEQWLALPPHWSDYDITHIPRIAHRFLPDRAYPITISGNNMNIPVVNRRIRFGKWGGYFINRYILEGDDRDACVEEMRRNNGDVENFVVNSWNQVTFIEGGRNSGKKVMEGKQIRTAMVKSVYRALDRKEMSGRTVKLVPVAFRYDKRVEDGVFPILKAMRPMGGTNYDAWPWRWLGEERTDLVRDGIYKATDVLAYASWPLRRPHGDAYVNIGKAVDMREFDLKGVIGHTISEIKRLYSQLEDKKQKFVVI